ncbi:hydroxyacid dehydrogenase [Eubacteriales bacterium OttesenSCG-928-N14]|nr:hydroxyacid dehydrogenase [Eubacteriales bacterium OttesenSCG-928-N14]
MTPKMKLISVTTLVDETVEKLAPYCDIELKNIEEYGRAPGEHLVNAVNGADIVVMAEQEIDRQMLEQMKDHGMKLLCCTRGTPVNVDWQAVHDLDIPLVHSPGRSRHSVAEFTIGLMIACTRYLALLSGFTAKGKTYHGPAVEDIFADTENTEGDEPTGFVHPAFEYGAQKAFELYGRTLGLLGFGPIGREVCTLAKGFQMNVIAYDPFVEADMMEKWGAEKVELDDLLARSHIISNHMAVTPQTRGIIDKSWYDKMRKGVYIVNTGRAAVFDQKAFLDALQDGTVAGAGLDVFWREPLPQNHPLWNMENVVLTPHIAGVTQDMRTWQSRLIADDVIRFCLGEPLENRWTRLE